MRGTWKIKISAYPLKDNFGINISNVRFIGTTKIGELLPIKKNIFSRFVKTYYYIEVEKIEITGKIDEYYKITFSGKFLNENKIEGTWFILSGEFGNDRGYWEATRVIDEKNNSVHHQ